MRSRGDQFEWIVKGMGLALLLLAAATAASPGWFLKEVHQQAELRTQARLAASPPTRGAAVEAAFSGKLTPVLLCLPAADRFAWRVETPRGVPAAAFDDLEYEVVLLDEDLDEWMTLVVGPATSLPFSDLCPSLQGTVRTCNWRVQAQWSGTLLRSAAMSVTAGR